MTLVEQARKYVHEDGFSVFPLVPGEKKPFQKWNWKPLQQRKPSDSEVDTWFSMTVNLAIVTGAVSGSLLVLDFDDMGVFADWFKLTGIETRTVTTGKGVHLYFRCEQGFNGNFYVDGRLGGQARFSGGYVVAPPSVHPSGHVYKWVNHDAPVVAVSLDVLRVTPQPQKTLAKPEQTRPPKQAHDTGRQTAGVKDPVKYAQVVVCRECEKIAGTQEGQRVIVLYNTACHVLRKFQGVLDLEEMETRLIQAGMKAGLTEIEAQRTVYGASRHV